MGQLILPIKMPNSSNNVWIYDDELVVEGNYLIAFRVHWKAAISTYIWHPGEDSEGWYETLLNVGTVAASSIGAGFTGGVLGILHKPSTSRLGAIAGAGIGGVGSALKLFVDSIDKKQKYTTPVGGYYDYSTHQLFYNQIINIQNILVQDDD